MTLSKPLTGNDLIDCANANSKETIEVVSQRCGYADVETFKHELEKAFQHAGLSYQSFYDLFKTSETKKLHESEIEIAPASDVDI